MNWKVNQILINFLILFILLLFKGKKAVSFFFGSRLREDEMWPKRISH